MWVNYRALGHHISVGHPASRCLVADLRQHLVGAVSLRITAEEEQLVLASRVARLHAARVAVPRACQRSVAATAPVPIASRLLHREYLICEAGPRLSLANGSLFLSTPKIRSRSNQIQWLLVDSHARRQDRTVAVATLITHRERGQGRCRRHLMLAAPTAAGQGHLMLRIKLQNIWVKVRRLN